MAKKTYSNKSTVKKKPKKPVKKKGGGPNNNPAHKCPSGPKKLRP